ncbi:MAG: tetratricopeptide repeat protein, partial [Gemmatimonadetes bacterium]|nr:tetratricopeptide repeat protein [Gemmatimonadota bacterium]NIT88699.1 tetratricopeptide repeat protein [Gemmatimonadota bacterium]NIU73502.1 tetratricopeptide repeat protein [Gammaproteobacteria bacterium]NIY07911.1 tetratricopeptide repeat protein [Gemmatimonadota bacterium]NIY40618.1 tetratricopeptide repeat protein [Gemmatimonadota bacterium]
LLEALRIGERLSSPACMLTPLFNLAELHQDRGEWEAAEAWWRELLAKAQATGYVIEQLEAQCGIGMVRLEQGDLEGALAAERAARAILAAEEDAVSESRVPLTQLSARLAAATGEVEGARTLFEQLFGEVEGQDPYVLARFRVDAAEALFGREPEYARELAARALETFRELGAGPMATRAEAILEREGGRE